MNLSIEGIEYFSQRDEDLFFQGLHGISSVANIEGHTITMLNNQLPDEDLRDLLALFFRYAAPMHQFRTFLTDTNKAWFRDNKSAFWHSKVFQNEETNLHRDA